MLIEPLHDYFLNDGIDDAGRTLRQVIGMSDDWLESKHDFIQWMFPLVEKSGANPGAPLIDVNLVTLFRINERPRNNMLLGFDRMLKFYGLQREGTAIAKAKNWNERKEYWFTQPTHNDLRISRMLKSMTVLSLEEYARSFFDALMRLAAEPGCGFSEESVGYWKAAIVKRPISFDERA